jgi:hypothetical protein
MALPKEDDMIRDVLFPDDGMPRDGVRGKPKKKDFRQIQGKAHVVFENHDRKVAKANEKPKRQPPPRSPDAGATLMAADSNTGMGKSFSDSTLQRPTHFLQRGFGLGGRVDILKCFGANYDCAAGPGTYEIQNIGGLRYNKEDGTSNPQQMTLTNHKMVPVHYFGKPKPNASTGPPPLARAPGPGHYGVPDYWDPMWQRYPSLGKSFVRKLPPAGESRFGGLAQQQLRNSKGDMSFLE